MTFENEEPMLVNNSLDLNVNVQMSYARALLRQQGNPE